MRHSKVRNHVVIAQNVFDPIDLELLIANSLPPPNTRAHPEPRCWTMIVQEPYIEDGMWVSGSAHWYYQNQTSGQGGI